MAPTRGRAGRRGEALAVLREADGPMTIAEVAERLGVHVNTVRFHLEGLVAQGSVEQVAVSSSGPGRPAQRYRARPGMDPAGPRNYQLLAEVLVGSISGDDDAQERALASGRAWGARLVADKPAAQDREQEARQLVEMLEDLGFAPEHRTEHGEERVALRHCPFLDLVGDHREVICPVHLGLMLGAADRLGGRVRVESLVPFVEPDMCLARLE